MKDAKFWNANNVSVEMAGTKRQLKVILGKLD